MARRRSFKALLGLLRESRSVASELLRWIGDNKICRGKHLWVFTLLSMISYSSRSMEVLLEKRQALDALLILRSIHDRFIDIAYLLANPSRARDRLLYRMFAIERAEDDYNEIMFMAQMENVTLDRLIALHPHLRGVVEKRERLRKDPISSAPVSAWPKRWQKISIDEKRKDAFGQFPQGVRHQMSVVGNAIAHSRPHALRHFMLMSEDGEVKPATGSPWLGAYTPTKLCALAVVQVVVACYCIASEFRCPPHFDERLLRMAREVAGPSVRLD